MLPRTSLAIQIIAELITAITRACTPFADECASEFSNIDSTPAAPVSGDCTCGDNLYIPGTYLTGGFHQCTSCTRASNIITASNSTPGASVNRPDVSNVITVAMACQMIEKNQQKSEINTLRRTAEELSRNKEILQQENQQLTVANRRLRAEEEDVLVRLRFLDNQTKAQIAAQEKISAETQAHNELLERNAQLENALKVLQSQRAAPSSNFDSRAYNIGVFYTGITCEILQKYSNDFSELIHIMNTSGPQNCVGKLQGMLQLCRNWLTDPSKRQGLIAQAQSVLGNPLCASGALCTVATPSQTDDAPRPADSNNGCMAMDQEVVSVPTPSQTNNVPRPAESNNGCLAMNQEVVYAQAYSNPASTYEVALPHPAGADTDLDVEMSDSTDDSHPVSQGFQSMSVPPYLLLSTSACASYYQDAAPQYAPVECHDIEMDFVEESVVLSLHPPPPLYQDAAPQCAPVECHDIEMEFEEERVVPSLPPPPPPYHAADPLVQASTASIGANNNGMTPPLAHSQGPTRNDLLESLREIESTIFGKDGEMVDNSL
ncbi:hypothetical protein QFC19_003924 [Naganishia cerealis]|uniref:Uncharacterized protein n=1 Tax=Naganishia cerealis TaxID=610337 RepID=A0ACC2VZE3_9TREE|nr:hypothetical protein QFC19_003924 [Naganishia cerealis]